MSIALAPEFAISGRLYVDYASDIDGENPHRRMRASGPDRTERHLRRRNCCDDRTSRHHQPLRRPAPDRPRQQPLHLHRRRRRRQRRAPQRPEPDQPARQDPPHRPRTRRSRSPVTVWSSACATPSASPSTANGDMVIADVGQDAREEIDFAPAAGPWGRRQGANYGWNCREGLIAGPGTDPQCATRQPRRFTPPVFDYPPHPRPRPRRRPLLDHRRLRRPRPCARGALRPLRLQRLLLRRAALAAAADDARPAGPATTARWGSRRPPGLLRRGRGARASTWSSRAERLPPRRPAARDLPTPRAAAAPVVTRPKLGPHRRRDQGQRRRVERGKRALLTVWVSPCDGRRGETVGAAAQRQSQRLPVPQPRLHRPLLAADRPRHGSPPSP